MQILSILYLQVDCVAEEELEVHFLKPMENKPNLYVWRSANDCSFPVLLEELCLLKEGAVEDVLSGRVPCLKV